MHALDSNSHGSCSVNTTSGATPLGDMQSLVAAQTSRMREQNKNHVQNANKIEKHLGNMNVVKHGCAHGVSSIPFDVMMISVRFDLIVGDTSVVNIIVNKNQTMKNSLPAFLMNIMSHDTKAGSTRCDDIFVTPMNVPENSSSIVKFMVCE